MTTTTTTTTTTTDGKFCNLTIFSINYIDRYKSRFLLSFLTTASVQCITTCLRNGNCEVKMEGLDGFGSCVSEALGGECQGIPEQCARGNHISTQCEDCMEGQVKCVTTCNPNGICQVEMRNGPPGKKKGSCFPASFGGRCRNIPEQCFIGDNIETQCGFPCKEGSRNV